MCVELEKGPLVVLHIGKMNGEGGVRPEHDSFGKVNNVCEVQKVSWEARTMPGYDRVSLEYPTLQHVSKLESMRISEGTDEGRTHILGNILIGASVFR